MALDTTVGGANADSYASEVEALAYFTETNRQATWTALINASSAEALLRDAMLFIEAQTFIGARANLNDVMQALEFPRRSTHAIGITRPTTDGELWTDRKGRQWENDVIPQPVKDTQCEQALAMAQSGVFTVATPYKRRIIRSSKGEIEYGASAEAGTLCRRAQLLLQPFLTMSGGVGRSMRA